MIFRTILIFLSLILEFRYCCLEILSLSCPIFLLYISYCFFLNPQYSLSKHSISSKHIQIIASCLLILFSRTETCLDRLLNCNVGREEYESRMSDDYVFRWCGYQGYSSKLLDYVPNRWGACFWWWLLKSFLQRILLIDISINHYIYCWQKYPNSYVHKKSPQNFGVILIEGELPNLLDNSLTLVNGLIAEQLPNQIGGLLLQHLLIELQQLVLIHILDVVGSPRSHDQIQLFHAQVLSAIQHLPPQGCQVLLQGQVFYELAAVVGYYAEVVREVHARVLSIF